MSQPRARARSAKNPNGLLSAPIYALCVRARDVFRTWLDALTAPCNARRVYAQREEWAAFALEWIAVWDDVTSTADRLATARLWFEHLLDDEATAQATHNPDAISPQMSSR